MALLTSHGTAPAREIRLVETRKPRDWNLLITVALAVLGAALALGRLFQKVDDIADQLNHVQTEIQSIQNHLESKEARE